MARPKNPNPTPTTSVSVRIPQPLYDALAEHRWSKRIETMPTLLIDILTEYARKEMGYDVQDAIPFEGESDDKAVTKSRAAKV